MGFWMCSSPFSPGKGVDSLIRAQDTGLSGRSVTFTVEGAGFLKTSGMFLHMVLIPVRVC